MTGGGNGWNDCIRLDTGHYACRWHLAPTIALVGCDHLTEVEALQHAIAAAHARAAISPTTVTPDLEAQHP